MPDDSQDIVHGVGKTSDEAPLSTAKKTAAMPDLSEVNDRTLSAGSTGVTHGTGSGKGGHEPRGRDENKGIGSAPGGPHGKEDLAGGETSTFKERAPPDAAGRA
ncbi:hypothetical protein H2198_007093 [Neophaeococcomyces mojaviensis]|uniref:Uncharacterized protein n=1 Tax=Neophaeococcomyces mojaviensis TaxID=3383035 RepID=A0ACC3A128_9EURO|nr:hypothetical protein H2198_007093 [Knufia sp. JES_112]